MEGQGADASTAPWHVTEHPASTDWLVLWLWTGPHPVSRHLISLTISQELRSELDLLQTMKSCLNFSHS